MKKIILLILLSFFIIAVYGCDKSDESTITYTNFKLYRVNTDSYEYSCKIREGHNVKYIEFKVTLSLDLNKERFILSYETNKDSSFFDYSLLDIDPDYKLSNDKLEIYSQFKVTTSYGVEIPFDEEKGIYYEFPGSYTIYISYADASEEVKNYINQDMYLVQCFFSTWVVNEESREKGLF